MSGDPTPFPSSESPTGAMHAKHLIMKHAAGQVSPDATSLDGRKGLATPETPARSSTHRDQEYLNDDEERQRQDSLSSTDSSPAVSRQVDEDSPYLDSAALGAVTNWTGFEDDLDLGACASKANIGELGALSEHIAAASSKLSDESIEGLTAIAEDSEPTLEGPSMAPCRLAFRRLKNMSRRWRLTAARQITCIEAMEKAQANRQRGEFGPVRGAGEAAAALESLGVPVSLQVAHEIILTEDFRFRSGCRGSPAAVGPSQRLASRMARKEVLDRFHEALEAIQANTRHRNQLSGTTAEAEASTCQEAPTSQEEAPAAGDPAGSGKPGVSSDLKKEFLANNEAPCSPASSVTNESLLMVAAMVGEKVVFERVLELRDALMDLGISVLTAVALPRDPRDLSTASTGYDGVMRSGMGGSLDPSPNPHQMEDQRGGMATEVAATLDPILILQMLSHDALGGDQVIKLFSKVAGIVAAITPAWLDEPFAAWWTAVEARLEDQLSKGSSLVEEIPFVFEECLEEIWLLRLTIANAQLSFIRSTIIAEDRAVEFECYHLTQLLTLAKHDILEQLIRSRGDESPSVPSADAGWGRHRILPLTETLKWLDAGIEELQAGGPQCQVQPREVYIAALMGMIGDRRPPMLLPAKSLGTKLANTPSCGVQRLPEILALDADRVGTWHASAQRIALVAALGTVAGQVLQKSNVVLSNKDIAILKKSMLMEMDDAISLQSALAGICTAIHMIAADRGKWIAARREGFCPARLSSALAAAANPTGPMRTLLHGRLMSVLRDGITNGIAPEGQPMGRREGPLAELRKKCLSGSQAGLCLMIEEIESLIANFVSSSELHYRTHEPLVKATISTHSTARSYSSCRRLVPPVSKDLLVTSATEKSALDKNSSVKDVSTSGSTSATSDDPAEVSEAQGVFCAMRP